MTPFRTKGAVFNIQDWLCAQSGIRKLLWESNWRISSKHFVLFSLVCAKIISEFSVYLICALREQREKGALAGRLSWSVTPYTRRGRRFNP